MAIDAEVADRAALLRAAIGLATPDSLHLACAITAGATLFITNGTDFPGEVDDLQVMILDSTLIS